MAVVNANPPTTGPGIRFRPFGETRYTSGTLPTDFKFTGQREVSVAGGLYFFHSVG